MVMETLLRIERACADLISTYFAKEVALILHNKSM
jgi:delta-aminolevulinic acid dehydratase/porphobilinogen synthase